MQHTLSIDDRRFRDAFHACALTPAEFDHRAHVRLAYVHLAEFDADESVKLIRDGLLRFLRHHGVDTAKYHETMTRAWIMAVHHFMNITPPCDSAEAFIAGNPGLLDSKIMLTHYSDALLFSAEARARFIRPDLAPIP